MAYIKHTWETGEIVSADKLNHMEDCLVDHDENKQGKLTAGQNITISADNTISATGGGGEAITLTTATGTLTVEQLTKLQASTDNYVIYNATISEETSTVRLNFLGAATGYMGYSNSGSTTNTVSTMMMAIDTNTRAYTIVEKYVQSKLTAGDGISIDENNVITSTEKNWYDLTLTLADYNALNNGEQICGDLPGGEYTGETFKNDYFKVALDNTATTEGSPFYVKSPMTTFYVDTNAEEEVLAIAQKVFHELIEKFGFEYNYFKTAVYAANATDLESMTHEGGIEDNNVIYIQDITRQEWEGKDYTKEEDEKVRTALEKTRRAGAYAVSIKGDTDTAFFLISMEYNQAAYYDEGKKLVKWAHVEPYKFYSISFDTSWNRWFLNNVYEDEGEVFAEEMSAAEKARLLNTGISFAANSLSAVGLFGDTIKYTECAGNRVKDLIGLFSMNTPFVSPTEEHSMISFGRPVAYLLDAFDYRDGAELVTEKEGEWVWAIPVNGMNIEIVIPKTRPYVYAIQKASLNASSSSSADLATTEIYRHTFTLTTDVIDDMPVGSYAINLCMLAVNAQSGSDDAMFYLLESDQGGQTVDWMLPVTGVIGQVEEEGGQKVIKTWYTALRMIAGYHEVESKEIRCLFITYFDPATMQLVKAPVIDKTNYDFYNCRDFRSVVDTVCVPTLKADVALAE